MKLDSFTVVRDYFSVFLIVAECHLSKIFVELILNVFLTFF